MSTISSSVLEAIAFVGNALSPFFLNDPEKGDALRSFLAFSRLDSIKAAREWPFVSNSVAGTALEGMVVGLNKGITDELAMEYRRLFVGSEKAVVAPYGSAYIDEDGKKFGESTQALRDWMRANGVQLNLDPSVPEDHIGTMLANMAWLAQNKPECLEEFLEKYLLTWAPHFLELMENAAVHPFYCGLAALARMSLLGIKDKLGLKPKLPFFYR